jgi:leader peptidase (prepilin peptidase)/N-methyltransferase
MDPIGQIAGYAAVALSPCVGSALACCVERISRGENFIVARSCCPACETVLGAADLVPIVSFTLLRGRCRHCGAPIPADSHGLEIVYLVVTLVLVVMLPSERILPGIGLGWLAVALAFTAWRAVAGRATRAGATRPPLTRR